jgi:UDP:flavonoid glycosyltransferase YjiC (YdhE family)
MNHKSKFKWAFFSHAYNLGDFSRAIETAKGMCAEGAHVKFFNHGGIYLDLLEKNGIASIDLLPEITKEQDETLMAIDQLRAPLGTALPFTEEQLKAMVEADIAALSEYKPDGIYCGLNVSSMISAPYFKLPRVTLVPTALCPAFYHKGLATFPNTLERNFFLRYMLPGFVKKKLFNAIMLKDVLKKTMVTFNKVRRYYGLGPIYNYTDFVKSDLTLLPDLPELSGLPANNLPPHYCYTGPIFARMDVPIAAEIIQVFKRPGLKIFCSLGSSGSKEVLKTVITILREHMEFNAVCATTSILDPKEFAPFSNNFFAARFMPAHLVNEMADIAVTHGGQGTIQTCAWAGTPVVGIGFQAEQQANIDGLKKSGMATRLPLYSVNRKTLLQAIEQMRQPRQRENALKIRQIVRSHDGVAEAVRRMNELLGK